MSLKSLFVLVSLLTFVSYSFTATVKANQPIHAAILDNFKHDVKTMFKVWNFIFNKSYDHSSIEGANRYETFQNNLKKIEEHNKLNKSYKKGINHLTDMTDEEVAKHYNLKPMNMANIRKSIRKLRVFNLDDYVDDEEEMTVNIKSKIVKKPANADHRRNMKKARDQGQCGSCWAFSIHAVMEGMYSVDFTDPEDNFAVQQSVDCDFRNHGCNGGWPAFAFDYFTDNYVTYEKNYQYTAEKGTCQYSESRATKIKVASSTTYYAGYDDSSIFTEMLAKGPLSIAVAADSDWYNYSEGIFSEPCQGDDYINHAVVLVGYQAATATEKAHYIVRNSWGTSWGENGHIRIEDNDSNNLSCNVERYGFQATLKEGN